MPISLGALGCITGIASLCAAIEPAGAASHATAESNGRGVCVKCSGLEELHPKVSRAWLLVAPAATPRSEPGALYLKSSEATRGGDAIVIEGLLLSQERDSSQTMS
jgi:hypothetical protein